MYNKKPPFEITTSILDKIAEIAELVGQVSAVAGLTTNPMLRRTNRIRTIYSSLAIEQNTLSLEQVTAVLSGKRVIAPPKDIAEVKNAYEIYEMMDSLNPYSVDDLLNAHAVMTKGLTEESGCFRSGPVGVVDKQGNILHFGTLPDYAPGLTIELLETYIIVNFFFDYCNSFGKIRTHFSKSGAICQKTYFFHFTKHICKW